jgi:hypothetical protein
MGRAYPDRSGLQRRTDVREIDRHDAAVVVLLGVSSDEEAERTGHVAAQAAVGLEERVDIELVRSRFEVDRPVELSGRR